MATLAVRSQYRNKNTTIHAHDQDLDNWGEVRCDPDVSRGSLAKKTRVLDKDGNEIVKYFVAGQPLDRDRANARIGFYVGNDAFDPSHQNACKDCVAVITA